MLPDTLATRSDRTLKPSQSASVAYRLTQRQVEPCRNHSYTLCNLDALPGFGLRGLDLFTPLAAQDAHEAAHCVRLPISGFHDLRQGGALRALQHGDDLGLLVAWRGRSFTDCFLRVRRLLRGLGLLGRAPLSFWL